MNKHVRFAIGAAVIAGFGGFISQPVVLKWLGAHPVYDAVIAAAGIAYHAYNTYTAPSTPSV
jgi:uncharacterized membrane protein YebE (DUF533 family)